MPPVIIGAALAGGAAGLWAGITIGGAAALGAFLSVGGGTLLLGGINYIVNRPKKLGTNFSQTNFWSQTEFTIFDPAAHRRIIYGKTSSGGILAYKEKINQYLTALVVMYAGHECDAISGTYINGKLTTSTQYNRASYTPGNLGITIFRGQNVLWNSDQTSNILPTIFNQDELPFEISNDVFGYNDGIWKTKGKPNRGPIIGGFLSYEYVPVERIDNKDVVHGGLGAGATVQVKYVWVNDHLGSDDQTADDDLMGISDKWTTNHRLRGICYQVIFISPHLNAFPKGLESIKALIKGRKVYDPRTDTTYWTDNVALCAAYHWIDTRYGFGADYDTTINETALIAAANICDETVPLAAGGNEIRYKCNGYFDTSQTIGTTLLKIVSAMAGKPYIVGDRLVLKAGAYETPTISIQADNIIGPITCKTGLPDTEIFNGIKGIYRDENDDYIVRNFPPQISSTFETEDGRPIYKDVQLEFTVSHTMAQRITRILLLESRQQITWQADHNLHAWSLMPGNTALVTIPRFGWAAKVFEITGMSLAVSPDRVAVKTQYREIASSAYDWSTSIEQAVDPAPDTNLPDPSYVPTPTNLVAQSGELDSDGNDILIQLTDGTLLPRILLTWDMPEKFSGRYLITWTNVASGGQTRTVYTGESTVTSFYITGIKAGDIFNITVVAQNTFGAKSDPASIYDHSVIGKTSAPPDIDTFTVFVSSDRKRVFYWSIDNIPLDVRSGGGYKIRYKKGFTSGWPDAIDLHEGLLNSSPYETLNPQEGGNYTFFIKAVDSSGIESGTEKIFQTYLPPFGFGNVFAFTDVAANQWPGTRGNCFVHPSKNWLVPYSVVTWNNAGLWDSLGAWNDKPVPVYFWESNIYDRGALISALPKFTIVTDANYSLQEKHSDDNIVWTDYDDIIGVITYRYIRFKLTLYTYDT